MKSSNVKNIGQIQGQVQSKNKFARSSSMVKFKGQDNINYIMYIYIIYNMNYSIE